MTPEQLAARLRKAAAGVPRSAEDLTQRLAEFGKQRYRGLIQEYGAVDTGTMLNSVEAEVDGAHAEVGANTDYAGYVAYGTSRVTGRPFHTDAAAEVRDHAASLVPSMLERMKP